MFRSEFVAIIATFSFIWMNKIENEHNPIDARSATRLICAFVFYTFAFWFGKWKTRSYCASPAKWSSKWNWSLLPTSTKHFEWMLEHLYLYYRAKMAVSVWWCIRIKKVMISHFDAHTHTPNVLRVRASNRILNTLKANGKQSKCPHRWASHWSR